jgi:CBS domain-containing protein
MRIEEWMTRTVKACRPEDTLADAARLMWDEDCGCCPVIDEDGRALGMITDRDVCMAALLEGGPLHSLTVGNAMSKELIACAPTDLLEVAAHRMQLHQVRRLPVLDRDGYLVGIISINDLARAATPLANHIPPGEIETTLAAVGQPRTGPMGNSA